MPENSESPEKKSDDAWKAKAKAEKEKLAHGDKPVEDDKPKETAPDDKGRKGVIPKACIQTLVTTFASNALISLGEVVNPAENEKKQDLDGAKFAIDMLDVIQKKTSGNLTDEESRYLEAMLYDLRLRFVEATRKKQG